MRDGELVREETLLYARIEDELLIVHQSAVVSMTGRLYAPILALLAERCTEVLSAEEVVDESMCFGMAHTVIRKIWAVCPGPDHPHRCRTSVDIDAEVRDLVEQRNPDRV